MKVKSISKIKTENEARQIAIDWQIWASKKDLSYSEISQWQNYFKKIADKFNLKDEFVENGII